MLSINYERGQLWAAHLGANQAYVVDLKTNQLVKAVTGTPGTPGVEVVRTKTTYAPPTGATTASGASTAPGRRSAGAFR